MKMALYESVIIGRQDLTPNQFEELIDEFIKIKETELRQFETSVHPWERQKYFNVF